jgi:glycosyltransferase involved in cell wall biosynthesis
MTKERTIGIEADILQESGFTFAKGVDLKRSGGGAHVGGAARAFEDQFRGLAAHGQTELNRNEETGREGEQEPGTNEIRIDLVAATPLPYEEFEPAVLELPAHARTHLFPLPAAADGSTLPYDSLIQSYTQNTAWMEQRRASMGRQGRDGSLISISHFYVASAVRDAIYDSLEAPVRDQVGRVTLLHSAPAYVIRAENPSYYADNPATDTRIQFEKDALAASIVVFSTEGERQLMIANYEGVPYGPEPSDVFTREMLEANSVVVPLCFNEQLFQPDLTGQSRQEQIKQFAQYGIRPEDTIFMAVTRLDEEKNWHGLVRAWMQFMIDNQGYFERPDAEKLMVIGSVPLKSPRLMELYQQVMGEVDEFKARYGTLADKLVLPGAFPHERINHIPVAMFGPSFTETFHLVPKEANASGVAFAGSDIAAHRETHGSSAFLFDPNTYEGFASAFTTMLNPADRAAYAAAGIKNSERFNRKAATRELVQTMRAKFPVLTR